MVDILAPDGVDREIDSILGRIEEQLLGVVREGAHGTRKLEDVLAGLAQLVLEVRQQYVRLNETLERRDLPFEVVARFETMRRRSLWLYRKARLEHSLFAKLWVERRLRDSIYRQILEAFQELSSHEEAERELRTSSDESLGLELLKESGPLIV